MSVLVPSLGILLFNTKALIDKFRATEVLVPSLGILLFNVFGEIEPKEIVEFSSPLWGFFYLI